ncbi:MAG: hypothetical protein KA105_02955 [Caulobacter sp.]|jgi:hypothetical protein|nr:hypothetical protein [Caulobacter sp.]
MQNQVSNGWEDLILPGEFEAIPDPFRFRDSFRFAYLIDGYQIAGGFEALQDLANGTGQAAGPAGLWFGDARTLWLILFFENRRYRHFGAMPEGQDEVRLDRLCQKLREELLAIAPKDRSAFLAPLITAPTS